MNKPVQCPCGKGSYSKCCGRFLSGQEHPKTCEELMRSRYTAFALKEVSYIGKTMSGPAKKGFDEIDLKKCLEQQEFIGLKILRSSEKGNKGTVEFQARYRIGNEEGLLHEVSEFIKLQGKWVYYSGKIL